MLNAKEDNRPKKGWWAPGHYMNICKRCKEQFIGDKRAMECADCAYNEPHHIVVPADDEPKHAILWVCTKCWPATNEVLTLGGHVPAACGLCGAAVTVQEINPIWRSWLVAVLRRHWEEEGTP